jgi:hypothetical protein
MIVGMFSVLDRLVLLPMAEQTQTAVPKRIVNYWQEPIILINEPYHLKIMYPDWFNKNNPKIVSYKFGKVNGKVSYIVEPPQHWHWGSRDTMYQMVANMVYEDEGTFASAGLFHNGNYKQIKLKSFARAVEAYEYNHKYDYYYSNQALSVNTNNLEGIPLNSSVGIVTPPPTWASVFPIYD